MLTLVGMQGVGTSSCYDRKVRSEIHSPAAYHHKSTDCLIKITVHLQPLTTPHQIRAVRSFGEYRPGENEIDVSARQRSQQLWRENPQFRAILAVNFESENDSNKLSGGGCEIRTHGTFYRPVVFKTTALNRSANPPSGEIRARLPESGGARPAFGRMPFLADFPLLSIAAAVNFKGMARSRRPRHVRPYRANFVKCRPALQSPRSALM